MNITSFDVVQSSLLCHTLQCKKPREHFTRELFLLGFCHNVKVGSEDSFSASGSISDENINNTIKINSKVIPKHDENKAIKLKMKKKLLL